MIGFPGLIKEFFCPIKKRQQVVEYLGDKQIYLLQKYSASCS
jgi:hypothetical protein